jgi:hypothetical protein
VKFLIEGEKYPLRILEEIFIEPKFYLRDGDEGILVNVGYYHNYKKNLIIYLLPKVFMLSDGLTIFGLTPTQLLNFESDESFKHKKEYLWIRQISIYFYKALLEFKKRSTEETILNSHLTYSLNSISGKQEFSYLDLILSFVNFYRKNKNLFVFKKIKKNNSSNINWVKLFNKGAPFYSSSGHPIYLKHLGTKKSLNTSDDLLTLFFSILNNLNEELNLNLKFNVQHEIIVGEKFRLLQRTGLSKLRDIKYKYFNDTFKNIYRLCELYFSLFDHSSLGGENDEFISVRNFNIIFEDMIDKLFSDNDVIAYGSHKILTSELKYQADGKILDHIFNYQSVIDNSNIFYIGDSKYYKPQNVAGKISQYKQFTYAKNIIQYNIDLLNTDKKIINNIRYRDELTEGYNITPNFFLYGHIEDFRNLSSPDLKEKGEVVRSFHFEDRLFDRDSLFVHQYSINFLFVLKNYSQMSSIKYANFRNEIKILFRNNFIEFLNNSVRSNFSLFKYIGDDVNNFVESNFRILSGKCIKNIDGVLIVAKFQSDDSLNKFNSVLQAYRLK